MSTRTGRTRMHRLPIVQTIDDKVCQFSKFEIPALQPSSAQLNEGLIDKRYCCASEGQILDGPALLGGKAGLGSPFIIISSIIMADNQTALSKERKRHYCL